MLKDKIYAYVRTLFTQSADGYLTAGDADDRVDYAVDWDAGTAEKLAVQCGRLVACLSELAVQSDELPEQAHQLTPEQQEVWNTYLRPFPDHGLDPVCLQEVLRKSLTDEALTEAEEAVDRQYSLWFAENAQSRLPYNRCQPTDLLWRARRYARLVQLKAPMMVLETEAKYLAEEYVLYHCMKQ